MAASILSFTIISPEVAQFGPRLGSISLLRRDGSTIPEIHTPGLITSCSRGVVPHLSRGHVNSTTAIRWANIPFESLYVLPYNFCEIVFSNSRLILLASKDNHRSQLSKLDHNLSITFSDSTQINTFSLFPHEIPLRDEKSLQTVKTSSRLNVSVVSARSVSPFPNNSITCIRND